MALGASVIADLARRLEEAERTRVVMPQLSMLHPGMTIDDAYAVQLAWRDLKLAAGRTVAGRKIGLTSRAMQRAQEVDEPDRGIYFDDMMWTSGATIPHGRFIRPRVEAEVAFELARPLQGPGIRLTDVLDATAWIYPALEIVDSRLEMKDPATGRSRIITDAIGDNAANAGMITGGRPVRPDAVDLRWIAGVLYINGAIEETGVSAAVLGHPASGIAWLANSLVPHGEKLEAGLPILAGAFTRSVFVHAGDTLHADYGPLGAVTARFA
jgi:2-oxo-hept-3-ene-1,7-dioate hydratase